MKELLTSEDVWDGSVDGPITSYLDRFQGELNRKVRRGARMDVSIGTKTRVMAQIRVPSWWDVMDNVRRRFLGV